jgi:uncharacterized membrane protein
MNLDYFDAAGKKDHSEATLGVHFWPGTGQGWYQNDTFTVSVNGVPLRTNAALTNTHVVEQGASALVETTLVSKTASVRLRFSYHPNQEGLDVQAALLPSEPPLLQGEGAGGEARPQLSLDLSCFPAFFTAWNKRRGDRWVTTPTRSLEEPREPGLDLKSPTWKSQSRLEPLALPQENWLFYYDKIFNSPDGNGRGVCGLIFLPEQLQKAQVNVTDYGLGTTLTGNPGQSPLAFTLWQNTAQDWAPQLQRFPALADAARQRLQDPTNFLPQTLVGFKIGAEVDALKPLTEVAEYRKLVAQAEALGLTISALEPERSVEEEPAVLAQLTDYRRAVWQASRALNRPRRLLVIEGPDYPCWQLDEAATADGALQIDKSYFSTDYRGDRFTTFPATEAEMLRYDAVVLVNVSATPLRASGEALLKQFVTNGGGLLVLGGFYAWGEGSYQQSVLADLLPATSAGPFDVKRLPAPARLLAGTPIPGLPAPPTPAVVLWLQTLQPKPDAAVPVTADLGSGKTAPFLIIGRAGAGRVAVCAGTVYGDPSPTQTPFWTHPAWPAYLASLLHWLCTPSS